MKKDNKKALPDYILRRVPRHLWNTLLPVPTWEGVLYYDPLDFKLDRPLTFYRRLHRRGAKADFIYPLKVFEKDVERSHSKQGKNSQPMLRREVVFNYDGKFVHILCHQLTMLCYFGFAIADPRHWVVDHIDGNPLNDRPSNLQVISQSENCRRSAKIREQARKNCEMINARRRALREHREHRGNGGHREN